MAQALMAIVAIYVFVLLGFGAKQIFGAQLHERTLTIVSIYLLQPFLTIWGLTRKPFDYSSLTLPLSYLALTFLALGIVLFFGYLRFSDPRDRSLLSMNATVGNTGNIGLPIVLAIYGEEALYHASLIAIANTFFVYIIGVYFYSRGQFSLKESLLNIVKLPIIWAAIFALLWSMGGVAIPSAFDHPLKMGAYAALVLQLILLGTYLCAIHAKEINPALLSWSVGGKLLFVPLLSLLLIPLLPFSILTKTVLFLQLCVPMAVNNVSLAALYDCKPEQVAAAVFVSSLLFAALLPLYLYLAHYCIAGI